MSTIARHARFAIALSSVAVSTLGLSAGKCFANGEFTPREARSGDVVEHETSASTRRAPRVPRCRPEHWNWR